MIEPEKFLQRWSKRKLGQDKQPTEQVEQARQTEPADQKPAPEPQASVSKEAEDKPFDLSALPPIESIDANTDISGFLRPGVPAELSRAALRRAWSADPAIRDFVGLVENGWDFNDPQAMAGFGPISTDEVARIAGRMLDALPDSVSAEPDQALKEAALRESDELPASSMPRSVEHTNVNNDAAAGESEAVDNDAQNVASQKVSKT